MSDEILTLREMAARRIDEKTAYNLTAGPSSPASRSELLGALSDKRLLTG